MAFLTGRLPVFTLIIFGKILFVRAHIFPDAELFPVILFELTSIFLLMGLVEVTTPQRKISSFLVLNLILSTSFLSMIMYYDQFGRILDYHALLQAPVLKDLRDSIADLFSAQYLALYLDIGVFASTFFMEKRLKKTRFALSLRNKGRRWLKSRRVQERERMHQRQRVQQIQRLILILSAAFTLSLSTVRVYPEKENIMAFAQNAGLLNAEFYQIYQIWAKEESSSLPINSFTQANINQIKQLPPIRWPKYFAVARGKNLIMVQLESTQNFVIGLKVNGQEVTPNLNRLAKESLYFPYIYSQIGQGNTSDAEFIVNTSIYPLASGAISSEYQGIDFTSLPRLLKRNGYSSVTFHPNVATFWNRDKLYPALGFDRYYDKSFYGEENKIGRWGASDEALFQKGLPILYEFAKQNRNFYASFVTLTNHHPYTIPKEKRLLKLPPNLEQTFIGNYLTTVNYADYALGKFFESLKASGLWENSVIVAYGDHFGINNYQSTHEQEDLTKLLGKTHDALDALNVPLMIKVPGIVPQLINRVGGQVDILPTLANLFGIFPDQQLVFGQDLLNTQQNLVGFRYYYPEGTFISGDLFHIAGEEVGYKITSHEIVENKEFYDREEERIKQLIQLSDLYLEKLKDGGKQNGIRVEVLP